jgi:tetratricopeptide (TPR) repeat protein
MTDNKWNAFPHTSSEYNYEGDALKANWEQLHLGNKELYPSEDYVKQLCATYSALKQSLPHEEMAKIAEDLQQAWRLYHRGEYQQAYEMGISLGVIGYLVASRSQSMYAYYLEDNESRKRSFSKEAADRAEEMFTIMPKYANAYFINAYALGRYSQSISVIKALAQGLGGKIKNSAEKAIKFEPNHVEAHLALGTYHSEVIDKVGSVVAGLTYGAKKDIGIDHFEKALKVAPETPSTHIEYANGLLMLFGKKKLKEATQAYEKAAELKPFDATQRLDVELAKSELAD